MSSGTGAGVQAEGGWLALRRCAVRGCCNHGVALFGDAAGGPSTPDVWIFLSLIIDFSLLALFGDAAGEADDRIFLMVLRFICILCFRCWAMPPAGQTFGSMKISINMFFLLATLVTPPAVK